MTEKLLTTGISVPQKMEMQGKYNAIINLQYVRLDAPGIGGQHQVGNKRWA